VISGLGGPEVLKLVEEVLLEPQPGHVFALLGLNEAFA
jgi:hypothetical protein